MQRNTPPKHNQQTVMLSEGVQFVSDFRFGKGQAMIY